jgi:hypothetical protein
MLSKSSKTRPVKTPFPGIAQHLPKPRNEITFRILWAKVVNSRI